ncbi:hypothetical protein Pmar_PMAR012926 [Perkinsus marinus ATCC 50983]|uniref:Uncharacterized protein n=1 Tax=Perkinsus marinus (strain ATCC 50983 / TXsc) TaxID=423536 RepID=C5LWK0_PERM5|nr:hypothetical protein Pmar_PMAR012926 [Perkinsus marinus ATCC 50983]EEQ98913.1 hypothetical protein Pmar_PMAR012926 [Perkinsus marinus ATCC 50983]|eukprot:XP_002766196.1 hypothetical protein Pmar_PMAR012926 [Perkinsus marinus ATCC 50983]
MRFASLLLAVTILAASGSTDGAPQDGSPIGRKLNNFGDECATCAKGRCRCGHSGCWCE